MYSSSGARPARAPARNARHHIRRGHVHRRDQRHPEWHGQSQRPSHPGLVRIRHGCRSSGICELSASGCREWIDCPAGEHELERLAPGTTYYFRVRAENSAGYSDGQIMNFTTASPGSPPAVTTIAATSVGVTGATLNGSVIPNGLATDAWFEWGTDSTLASFSTTGTQAVGSGTTSQAVNQALTGLTTGTIYYYRVAASNGAGTSRATVLSSSRRGADGDDAHDDGGRDDRCDAQRERESERPGDRRMVRVGNQPEPGHLQHDIHPGAGGRGEFPAGDGDPVGIEFRDDLLLPGGCFQLDGTGEGVDRRASPPRLLSPSGSFPRLRRTMRRMSRWAIPSRSPSTKMLNPPPWWARSP